MKEFDPYNFDYKTYIKEVYNLNEMPNRWSRSEFTLDDPYLNSNEAVWVEKTAKLIGEFSVPNSSFKFRLYLYVDGDENTYYLLNNKKPFIHAEYSFRRIHDSFNKGIENTYLWNFKWDKGLIRMFFDHYIIEREPRIISDETQTDKGFNFWKYLFKEYAVRRKSHKMSVYDINNGVDVKQLKSENEMDDFFRDTQMANYRFVLEKL